MLIGPFDLEKPVGKKQQYVSSAQLTRRAVVFCVTKDPEHRIGLRSVKRERLSASPLPVNPKRGRVSRICIVQFATGNVGQQIQCRYKDRCAFFSRNSSAYLASCSSAFLRAVMSRVVDTKPISSPLSSRRDIFVTDIQTLFPERLIDSSTDWTTASPDRNMRRSSAWNFAAILGGRKSNKVLPTTSSVFVAPRNKQWERLSKI